MALLMAATSLCAVPAKRGVWRTIALENGQEVRVCLVGDEHLHYWQAADGTRYVPSAGGKFAKADMQQLERHAAIRRAGANSRRHGAMTRAGRATRQFYTGTKKGIVILAEFTDKKFENEHNQALFHQVANTRGYTENGFRGSVKDYFLAQSNGKFELDFDVVGPVQLSKAYAYYGRNDWQGNDLHAGEMVAEACKAVEDQVDFRSYDWDGDGYVDQVYVIYAGHGENDYPDDNVIWPHEFSLSASDYGQTLTIDGVKVDTYACSCEIDGDGCLAGIGTWCHEFSHCLGFPDFYDTEYQGHFGMGDWDLMSSGSYNGTSSAGQGSGYLPAGYSSYEKWTAGWMEPTELADEDQEVDRLEPQSEGGGAYVIYNRGNRNEYYLLENRQKTNWDAELPGKGLLVLHVDYDQDIWNANIVNTLGKTIRTSYTKYVSNDHERLTPIHADNDDDSNYWNSNSTSYTRQTQEGDPYPYMANDSLTNNSVPAAKVYHKNADGSYYLNRGVKNIRQNDDGTISFSYLSAPAAPNGDNPPTGINGISEKPTAMPEAIYSMSGVYVGRDAKALKKGIYIRAGKKFVVK